VAIGYYVVKWNLGALSKFAIIAIGALVLSVVLYDLVVRRANLTRFLFGLKPKVRKVGPASTGS
jgi:glucan biosynthesis protein C